MIEVELRGLMDKKEYDKVLNVFEKKAKFKEDKKRLSLVYFRGDGDFHDVREVKDDPVDLRVRITNNKKAEIMLKYGKWGVEEKRREISIPIKPEEFEEAIELFKALDWKTGVVTITDTKVYDYKGVEFAMVSQSGHYYFEAEILAKSEEDTEKANKEIKQVCKELGLELANEEKFMDMLNHINTINPFDFSKQSPDSIRKKFPEYF